MEEKKLITGKEVVAKLKQGGAADISTAYFSKIVGMGHIPYHTIPGKKRKLFKYDEAKKALLDMQDPTRDAQREAVALEKTNKRLNEDHPNTKKPSPEFAREIEELNERYFSASDFLYMAFSNLDIPSSCGEEEREEAEQILNEVQAVNSVLLELVHTQKDFFEEHFGFEFDIFKSINYEYLKLTTQRMVTIEEYLTETGIEGISVNIPKTLDIES